MAYQKPILSGTCSDRKLPPNDESALTIDCCAVCATAPDPIGVFGAWSGVVDPLRRLTAIDFTPFLTHF